jgi:hypothetical protein
MPQMHICIPYGYKHEYYATNQHVHSLQIHTCTSRDSYTHAYHATNTHMHILQIYAHHFINTHMHIMPQIHTCNSISTHMMLVVYTVPQDKNATRSMSVFGTQRYTKPTRYPNIYIYIHIYTYIYIYILYKTVTTDVSMQTYNSQSMDRQKFEGHLLDNTIV